MAADGYLGMGGEWIQVLAEDTFLMGCTDKRSARSALDRDPKTVDEAVSLMRRFHGHEKELSVVRRMRTLALEEVDPDAPQVNRVQEERSISLDVGESNENIEKLTKLLANMNMTGAWRQMGPVKCFSCGETGHLARYCRTNVQKPYPNQRDRVYVKAVQGKKHYGPHDKESGGNMDDVVEMREVMLRTGNDRCSLVRDMTINNHCVEAMADSGAQVSVLSRRFYDSLSCRPRPVESIRMKGASASRVMVGCRVDGVDVDLGEDHRNYSMTMYVADITDNCILGLDYLKAREAVIDLSQGIFVVNGTIVKG